MQENIFIHALLIRWRNFFSMQNLQLVWQTLVLVIFYVVHRGSIIRRAFSAKFVWHVWFHNWSSSTSAHNNLTHILFATSSELYDLKLSSWWIFYHWLLERVTYLMIRLCYSKNCSKKVNHCIMRKFDANNQNILKLQRCCGTLYKCYEDWLYNLKQKL